MIEDPSSPLRYTHLTDLLVVVNVRAFFRQTYIIYMEMEQEKKAIVKLRSQNSHAQQMTIRVHTHAPFTLGCAIYLVCAFFWLLCRPGCFFVVDGFVKFVVCIKTRLFFFFSSILSYIKIALRENTHSEIGHGKNEVCVYVMLCRDCSCAINSWCATVFFRRFFLCCCLVCVFAHFGGCCFHSTTKKQHGNAAHVCCYSFASYTRKNKLMREIHAHAHPPANVLFKVKYTLAHSQPHCSMYALNIWAPVETEIGPFSLSQRMLLLFSFVQSVSFLCTYLTGFFYRVHKRLKYAHIHSLTSLSLLPSHFSWIFFCALDFILMRELKCAEFWMQAHNSFMGINFVGNRFQCGGLECDHRCIHSPWLSRKFEDSSWT